MFFRKNLLPPPLTACRSKNKSPYLASYTTHYKQEERFNLDAHLRIAGGASSAEDIEDLAVQGHDPTSEFTVQGLELEPHLRFNDHILIANGLNLVQSSDNELEAELEESYASPHNLPGGFEVRGGRFLNRLGLNNSRHLHAWDFVR